MKKKWYDKLIITWAELSARSDEEDWEDFQRSVRDRKKKELSQTGEMRGEDERYMCITNVFNNYTQRGTEMKILCVYKKAAEENSALRPRPTPPRADNKFPKITTKLKEITHFMGHIFRAPDIWIFIRLSATSSLSQPAIVSLFPTIDSLREILLLHCALTVRVAATNNAWWWSCLRAWLCAVINHTFSINISWLQS